MNTKKSLYIMLALLTMHTISSGENQRDINLECSIERTINMSDGKGEATSGVSHISINFENGGKTKIIKNGREQYTGTSDDNYFRGSAQYEFVGLKMNETISINRYTGILEIDLKKVGDAGIRHTGICKLAARKF